MGSARKDIDPQRLDEWVRAICTTDDEEIDCDALSNVIAEVADAAAAGADVRALLPHVAVHLDHCPDCRDWYETLLAWIQEQE